MSDGVDLRELAGMEEAEPQEQQELTDQDLLDQRNEADPVLAMLSAQIFDMGNLMKDVLQRLDLLERSVGYLLDQDEGIQKRMKEVKEVAEANE